MVNTSLSNLAVFYHPGRPVRNQVANCGRVLFITLLHFDNRGCRKSEIHGGKNKNSGRQGSISAME